MRNALKGYNVTVLAYGQTSSGKTHTIRGNMEAPGIIPLTAKELFRTIEYLKSPEGIAGSINADSSFAHLDIPDSSEEDSEQRKKKFSSPEEKMMLAN